MKPTLQINTNLFMKHALFRHTHSGSIDFIQKSWKVGATGLKERNKRDSRSDEKIYPFQETVVQPADIEIIRELGVGGSSTVHLISYQGVPCALKVINLDDEKHQFKSSQNEIETLRRIKSKFIVEMRQAYIRNRRIAIILEYMNSGSLDTAYIQARSLSQKSSQLQVVSSPKSESKANRFLSSPKKKVSLLKVDFQKFNATQKAQMNSIYIEAKGITDLDVLASIAMQILLALKELENNQICHRDIKPSNVLLASVNGCGFAKLTDFGLAKILREDELCTEIIGTDRYHSPERLLYNSYDVSADIWSLGIMILETYLGEYPFQKQIDELDEDGFRKYIGQEFINDPSSPVHHLPSDLKKFINSCLSIQISDRPTTSELLESEFVNRIQSESQAQMILGRFIEDTKLLQPKVSDPVSIRSSSARRRRVSIAHQFFSVSSDESPAVELSIESPDLSRHFQKLSIDEIEADHSSFRDDLNMYQYGCSVHEEEILLEPIPHSPQSSVYTETPELPDPLDHETFIY